MTIFGFELGGRAYQGNNIDSLIKQGADVLNPGFRAVKGLFVKESFRSQMERAYNDGYKCSPELIGKICAVAASLVSAAYSGMYSGVMTCLMMNPVLSPVSLLVIFGAALGAAAIIISRDKQDIIHGMMGGAIAVGSAISFERSVLFLGGVASIGAIAGAIVGRLGHAFGDACGKAIGRFTPIRHLCGAAAAVAAIVARPFKG
jgi:hypothetical protein